jgi:hypothetical protein
VLRGEDAEDTLRVIPASRATAACFLPLSRIACRSRTRQPGWESDAGLRIAMPQPYLDSASKQPGEPVALRRHGTHFVGATVSS